MSRALREVFHRNSGYHHWQICRGHYPIRLEGSATGGAAGSYGQTEKPCYGSHNGIRWMRWPTLYLTTQWPIEALTPWKRDHPSSTPILGFAGRLIRLPLRFGDKAKASNLESTSLRARTSFWRGQLYTRIVIASYLLQLQFKVDDGSVDKLQGDQQTAWKWYVVNIRPLVEHSVERGPIGPPPLDKKQQTALPPRAEALVIHTLALVDPK
ncbi:hypothetical protein Cgig2_017721 [Carnegiea gigantea]|uniref:Uncharacterized protein n=1 Tax=Carnegiea gigantea TaxID=171969 RepID=A0A9Q1GR32_9CARY|nr:hypothetical protein Cgig2_017721 [Carnegiea gigantea]